MVDTKRRSAPRKPKGPAPNTVEIATTRDGNDVTRPLLQGMLQQPRDPRLAGAVDWGVYDTIYKDDQVFSTFQQRRTAVVSREWTVVPGDENDPRSVEAAARFNDTLTRIGWDRITDKMLFARFYGYAVAELLWESREGIWDFKAIRVRHARRFRFDDEGKLRLLKRGNMAKGEPVDPKCFWTVQMGGSDDDETYGRGLAEWLYWPVLFKRNGIAFWQTFLDKFGAPTALGKMRPGMSQSDQAKLLQALQAIATDSAILVPEGVAVELLQATRSGAGDYATMCAYMDRAISKIVLSQTMTTDDGASLSQAQVHGGVKLEVIKADDDLLSDSFNGDNGPARIWTDYNYGPDVAAPRVVRDIEEETDQAKQADTDLKLKQLGYVRTDDSFRDTYGEGYVAQGEREERLADAVSDGKHADAAPQPANDNADGEEGKEAVGFAAGDLRSLYVYRPLLNAHELIAWAQSQGFASTLPAASMHVTQAYSRTPVNWFKMGSYWGDGPDAMTHLVPPGGPRRVEVFGKDGSDKRAVVLVFSSPLLERRHAEMLDRGASWDFPDYYPHITFTYAGDDVDLSQVVPYRGELRFGPEIFEPINEDWQETLVEEPTAAFAAEDAPTLPERIDAATQPIIDVSGRTASRALTDPMIEAVLSARNAEELTALLNAAPGDDAPLAHAVGRASFAAALMAEDGDAD